MSDIGATTAAGTGTALQAGYGAIEMRALNSATKSRRKRKRKARRKSYA